MKLIRFACTSLALVSATAAFAAPPVVVNMDSSFEGISASAHAPLGSGTYEVGWLNPGVGQSQIVGFFNAGDLASIDNAFNTVSVFTFTPASAATAEPNFSLGLVFQSNTIVADGDNAALAAYKDPSTGGAGKRMFAWIRNPSSTQMAFVDSALNFGAANDTIGGTDFNTDFATASDVINGTQVWVGSIADVILGGAIDTNGVGGATGDAGAVNNLGYFGGANVLQLAPVVPEPTAVAVLFGGLALTALRRRRA